jgi:anti-anti-sigma factor
MNDAKPAPAAHATTTPMVEIIIKEDLTAHAAERLQTLLADALDLRPAQLIVDLAECSYADVRAVHVLLDAHRHAWRIGGRLTLRSPSQRMQRLLQLAHVDHVFNVTAAPSEPTTTSSADTTPTIGAPR